MTPPLVRSVKKALDALDVVVRGVGTGGGATLSDIAGRLNEQPTTVRNILKTMEQCGYLARDAKRYIPGPKCDDLRRGPAVRRWLAELEPFLRHAAAETGESFVVATLLDGRREVLARVQGGGEVVVNLKSADGEQPVYALVTTRVMLSRIDPAAVARFVEVNGPPGNEWPEAADGRLDLELAALRRQGYADSRNEVYDALAVAVTGHDGLLLGALGVFVPRFRSDETREQQLLARLAELAARAAR